MDILDIKQTVDPICAKHGVRRLDLFGSYARGEQHDKSDLDFCVAFNDFPPSEYAQRFFGFLHDLEDTLQRPIDLLTGSSIKKSSLKNEITQHGICIYGQ
jgi:uncharacterized protein